MPLRANGLGRKTRKLIPSARKLKRACYCKINSHSENTNWQVSNDFKPSTSLRLKILLNFTNFFSL